MTGTDLQKHVVVVGHGRSGTNLALDLFDCHRNTFCRNEPNELADSGFTGLGDPFFAADTDAGFAQHWQDALHGALGTNGARDRFGLDKVYFRSALRTRIGQEVMSRDSLRALLLPHRQGERAEHWPCPAFYYDPDALARALPVLKILLTPAWILQAHAAFPTQHVVHVVRPPAGFIQSWWSRYVTGIGGGPEKVFADNQPSVARILVHFGQDPTAAPYSTRNLLISELWRWRYMNEVLLDGLQDDPRYLLAPYADLTENRLSWAERLYEFAGLEMDDAARARIAAMENTLFRARKADALEPAMIDDATEDVLAGSPWRDRLLGHTSG